MCKKVLCCSLLLLSLTCEGAYPQECGETPSSYRTTVRHIEAKGVGYNQGYTSLDFFIAPHPTLAHKWVPFLDMRGHIFNNGKMAANAGFGIRYLSSSYVYGFNNSYDYRAARQKNYQQYSFGFEALGPLWDFRCNGYIPLGHKRSHFYNTQFSLFSGNQMVLEAHQEFAMKGVNAEAGIHIQEKKNIELYGAFGPYYFERAGKNAIGGKVRIAGTFLDYIKVEASTSYDPIFRWVGQGELSFVFSFGPKAKVKTKRGGKGRVQRKSECLRKVRLKKRALQPVDKFEIIVVGTRKTTTPAINPLTGLPYSLLFVDNTSHSAGTFESPYPTLAEAEAASSSGDIIYVLPGSGTYTMSQTLTLKSGQMLLGASIEHLIPTTLGTISIPAMAETVPNITNSAGDVITLSNNNTISGLSITTAAEISNGLTGTDISNLFVNQTLFLSTADMNNGIFLSNPSGTVVVESSTFDGFSSMGGGNDGNGIYINPNSGHTLNNFTILNNVFSNISNPSSTLGGNCVLVDGAGVVNLFNSTGNTFTSLSNMCGGIVNTSTINTLTSTGNTFSELSDSFGVHNSGTIGTLTSTGDSFSGLDSSTGVYNEGTITILASTGGSFSELIFSIGVDNEGTIATLASAGGSFNGLTSSNGILNGSTITTLTSTENIFSELTSNSWGLFNAGTITTLTSMENTFSGLTNGSRGVFNDNTIATCNLNHNTFSGIDSSSVGVVYDPTSTSSYFLQINNNTFSSSDPIQGYAATISISQGTLCLELTENNASASTGSPPNAYSLSQSGTGTGIFNLTTGSDGTTNTGGFTRQGTIGTPGSCTPPSIQESLPETQNRCTTCQGTAKQ